MNSFVRFFILVHFAVPLMAAEPMKHAVFEIRLLVDKLTADSEQMKMMRHDREGQTVPVVLNVAKGALLDDSDIKSAKFQTDPISGKPQVGISFTEPGRKAVAEMTRTSINKQLAILIDGKMVSAPIIRTEIREGAFPIEGDFTEKDAKDLAMRINKAVEEKQTGKMKPWNHGLYDGRRVD